MGPKQTCRSATAAAAFGGERGHSSLTAPRQLMTDAVEKGKNEPIEFFPCAPPKPVFRNPTHH